MDRRNVIILSMLLGVVVVAGGYALMQTSPVTTNDTESNTVVMPTAETCISDDCLKVDGLEYPVGGLPETVVSALNQALDDEYKARATYEAVLQKLGQVRPFSMIIRAEEQHIASLKSVYDKYGIPVPADPFSNIEVAAAKSENCSVGVQAETSNVALYKE